MLYLISKDKYVNKGTKVMDETEQNSGQRHDINRRKWEKELAFYFPIRSFH